ncbi:hypothetical protein J4T85_019435 [Sinorhizobium medicae]|uniref:hypothetical protein n=1 Tax=Sinorhizobium medicae TaxID=110321 RepID=UPI001AAFB0C6|nr:hypothetical protein [Sinorhizobium medicae]MBO1963888.1 hypothetical protein [Sinorhizobium medicae]
MKVTDHNIRWQGMAIRIRHVSRWSGTDFDHIEVLTTEPERAPLPITETGYRSHFLHSEDLQAHGGAVAFVLAWLDHDAKGKAWQAHLLTSRQLSLF